MGEKTTKITEKEPVELQWSDSSRLFELPKGESEEEKESDKGHRSGASAKRKGRKSRRKKSSG